VLIVIAIDFAMRRAFVPSIVRWADEISQWVPGFPDGRAIFSDDNLVKAITTYIVSGSVFHTADHFSYARIPLDSVPWRLRREPIQEGDATPLDLEALVSPEDFFRHQLAWHLFFKPFVIRAFRQIRWGFRDQRHRRHVKDFVLAFEAIDRAWDGSGFPTSSQIATSPQY